MTSKMSQKIERGENKITMTVNYSNKRFVDDSSQNTTNTLLKNTKSASTIRNASSLGSCELELSKKLSESDTSSQSCLTMTSPRPPKMIDTSKWTPVTAKKPNKSELYGPEVEQKMAEYEKFNSYLLTQYRIQAGGKNRRDSTSSTDKSARSAIDRLLRSTSRKSNSVSRSSSATSQSTDVQARAPTSKTPLTSDTSDSSSYISDSDLSGSSRKNSTSTSEDSSSRSSKSKKRSSRSKSSLVSEMSFSGAKALMDELKATEKIKEGTTSGTEESSGVEETDHNGIPLSHALATTPYPRKTSAANREKARMLLQKLSMESDAKEKENEETVSELKKAMKAGRHRIVNLEEETDYLGRPLSHPLAMTPFPGRTSAATRARARELLRKLADDKAYQERIGSVGATQQSQTGDSSCSESNFEQHSKQSVKSRHAKTVCKECGTCNICAKACGEYRAFKQRKDEGPRLTPQEVLNFRKGMHRLRKRIVKPELSRNRESNCRSPFDNTQSDDSDDEKSSGGSQETFSRR